MTGMTWITATTLFGALLVLALLPSVSAMMVAVRSATCGFNHGLFTSLGIVIGDVVFIVIAINGLALLAELLGEQFNLVRLLGGAYLIGLGIVLWRRRTRIAAARINSEASVLSSFLAGLFITLGDQKAILFYFGFFPAFIDASAVTPMDTALIIVMAAAAVGAAKLTYALMADRAAAGLGSARLRKGINAAAAIILIAVGVVVLTGIR